MLLFGPSGRLAAVADHLVLAYRVSGAVMLRGTCRRRPRRWTLGAHTRACRLWTRLETQSLSSPGCTWALSSHPPGPCSTVGVPLFASPGLPIRLLRRRQPSKRGGLREGGKVGCEKRPSVPVGRPQSSRKDPRRALTLDGAISHADARLSVAGLTAKAAPMGQVASAAGYEAPKLALRLVAALPIPRCDAVPSRTASVSRWVKQGLPGFKRTLSRPGSGGAHGTGDRQDNKALALTRPEPPCPA